MQLNLGLEDGGRSVPNAEFVPLDAAEVLGCLSRWQELGWLRLLDLEFARFLHRERPEADGRALLVAALTSHQLGRGHVCLDLDAALQRSQSILNLPPAEPTSSREGPPAADGASPVTLNDLLRGDSADVWDALARSGLVTHPEGAPAPLVREGGRVYLYRYWFYERQVARGIVERLRAATHDVTPEASLLRPWLDALFGPVRADGGPDWQRLACAVAARQRFSIVTGGPGTGKTTTVVRLLALLQALDFHAWTTETGSVAGWQPLRIRLAAPTGKAAARLGESIQGKVGELPLAALGGEALAGSIPTEVVTLHRLLGGRPHVRKRRYNADNLLPVDVLVVDEASMVSLEDMADLFAALPPHARLILVGDKDQLSSVEAGSVLSELCQRAVRGRYRPELAAWLGQATGQTLPPELADPEGWLLDQAVAMLRFSHRFDSTGGIGRLAQAVNEGDVPAVQALLSDAPEGLAHIEPERTDASLDAGLVVEGYGRYLALLKVGPASADPPEIDAWALKVLAAQRQFQVLCVVRNGPWGVSGLNASIARTLLARDLIPSVTGWYAGRPVMVTRNNPALRLTNGDIGVTLPYPADSGETVLRVAFADGNGAGVRWFAPNRLDAVETVFALTVHKSQGSEFDHACLVLPAQPTPVLTRELVYTGITRASRRFTLVNPGGTRMLELAVEQRIHRSSALGDLIGGLS